MTMTPTKTGGAQKLKSSNVKMAFGRHETFHVRDGWLPKGLHAISQNPRALHQDDSHHDLGVGTNMLKSIRYWVEAAGFAETHGVRAAEREMSLTRLGSLVLSFDPYMDHDGTWWLAHANLSRNLSLATTWHWFFNHGPVGPFVLTELEKELNDFCSGTSRPPTISTLRRDLQCLGRSYVGRDQTKQRAGDVDPIGCPLAALGLMTMSERKGEFQLTSSNRPTLPSHIFMATLTEFVKSGNPDSQITTTESARWGINSPGRIFGMNGEAISEIIERCRFEFGESTVAEIKTAGLSNIQIGSTAAESFIERYFEGLRK